MKEKPSEWIAISDLMAGVMAVMMLLLVLAIMQKGASELKYKQELEQSKSHLEDPLKKISQNIKNILNSGNANALTGSHGVEAVLAVRACAAAAFSSASAVV